jgi:hypothetical protein
MPETPSSGSIPYPRTDDWVEVRLELDGPWYCGTVLMIDSLHFTMNQYTVRLWRYGDFGVTWRPISKSARVG